MNDDRPKKDDEGGGAGWIMTFADLMSLLMCFFVLLLSFAELDIMKFKAIAGSMKLAFGVQREIKAIEVPKGTSIVAQEFSAAKPDPTVVNEVRQKTIEEDKQSLEFTDALQDDIEGNVPVETPGGETAEEREKREQAEADAEALREALREEIAQGMIEIETEGLSIIVRIREKGSFPSGKARFDPAFTPVILKLRQSLQEMDGRIVVAGHTDDVPIKTALYRSNWDLSSARAVSVVHALLKGSELKPARFIVEGHGEAHPLVANDTPENRAKNRRVEITIRQSPAATATGVAARRPDGERQQAQAAPPEPSAPALPAVPAVPGAPDPAAAPFALPIPAAVPGAQPLAPPKADPPFARSSVFPERPPEKPRSRLDVIRDGMRGQN